MKSTKYNIVFAITLILSLVSGDSNATEFKLIFGAYTSHPFGDDTYSYQKTRYIKRDNYDDLPYYINKTKKYNKDTNFVGIEYNDVVVGTFKNSYNIRSYIISYKFIDAPIYSSGSHQVSFNAMVGLTHGYGEFYEENDLDAKLMCIGKQACYTGSLGFEYAYQDEYFVNATVIASSLNILVAKKFSFK